MESLTSYKKYLKVFTQVRWQLVVILVCTFLSYLTIFDNQLIGDDRDFILNWPALSNPTSIPGLLAGDLPEVHAGTYRPVRSLLYLGYFQLWGSNTLGYHIHSFSVHVFVTVLLFFISRKIAPNQPLFAFLVSILFGTHPIHLEAITFITASLDTTAFAFMLLSFYLYLNYLDTRNSKFRNSAIILYLLALGTNEITYVYPLLLVLYHWLFSKVDRNALISLTKPFFIVLLAMAILRFGVLQITTRSGYAGGSFLLAQLISLKAFLLYLYLLLIPIQLGLIHILPGGISNYMFQDLNLNLVQSQSVFELSTIVSIVLIILMLSIIWLARKKKPLVSFGLGWFLISLLPVLNLLPTAVFFSERYAYLASVGFCIVLAFVLSKLIYAKEKTISLIGILVTLSLVISYICLSLYHNQFWQNEIVYWQKNVRENPENFLAHYQLAQVYQLHYQLDLATKHYKKSIEIEPSFVKSSNNLGQIYQFLHEYPQAISYYEKVLDEYPDSEVALANKSNSQLSWAKDLLARQDYSQAEVLLRELLSNGHNQNEARIILSRLCAETGYVCSEYSSE